MGRIIKASRRAGGAGLFLRAGGRRKHHTEGKKTTNERGTELFPLSFTTVLHSGAGVDVWAEIQSWKALVTKVNYFYLGGKKLGPKLQLRKVAVSNTKVDGKGRLLLATLSFTFKEYDPATPA